MLWPAWRGAEVEIRALRRGAAEVGFGALRRGMAVRSERQRQAGEDAMGIGNGGQRPFRCLVWPMRKEMA